MSLKKYLLILKESLKTHIGFFFRKNGKFDLYTYSV